MKAENRIDLNIDNKGKGRRFESRFLQAGLVKYSFGVCLLSKEVIDRFAYKFVGCPVIIDHKDITDANAKDERVGVISKVWYNEYDGWFWCEGVVFDDEAISLIKDKGYNVSCQYNIDDYTENTANALHNGNPYDITILDGTPEHLAIVKNPRYEEALIAVNKGEDMKAENTEFRTGYDSEGEAYVYPIEGADEDKSDKKEKKDLYSDENFKENAKRLNEQFGEKPYSQWHKDVQTMLKKYGKTEEDWNNAIGAKKETKKEDKKDSGYKIPDDYKKSVKDYTKEQHEKAVDEYGEKMAKAARKANAGIGKDDGGNQYKTYSAQFEEYKALKDYHEQQATKSEDKKEDKAEKKEDKNKYLKNNELEIGKVYKLGNIYVKPFKDEDGDLAFYDKTGVWGEGSLPQKFLKSDLENIKRVKKYDNLTDKELKFLSEISDLKPDKKEKEDKKEPKQLKLFNALEEQLERFVSLVAKNFDESKHDRDKDGKFTDSGNFSGESVDEQEKDLVKELKRLEKNGQDVSEIYKKLTGKEWGKKEAKKDKKKEKSFTPKSQKSDSVKFDKIGKVLTSILKDAEKSYKESK